MLSLLTATASEGEASQLNILLDRLVEFGISAGKHIIIAIVVFAIGRIVVKLINRVVARLLSRRHIEESVQSFLKSLVNILLMLLLVISVIGALGINTTSFAALLASAGVAIGMALSGNLQNFAGGIVILLFKPYKVGDWIEAQGVQGAVKEIQVFHTLLTMGDNKVVYIPNGSMSTAVVINYTRNDTRRVEWTIGIDYGESVEKARRAIVDALSADERVLTDPAPTIVVGALADSSVNILVRVWVNTENYWGVYHQTFSRIYDTFNERGINFPFPQSTVHVVKD